MIAIRTLFFVAAVLVGGSSAYAQVNSGQEMLRTLNQQAYGSREKPRDWRTFHKYDFDRIEKGQPRYDPARYYRDGRYYEARTLGLNDRLYRAGVTRFYCRRADGTTGLIDGLAGTGTGNLLALDESRPIGVLVAGRTGDRLERAIARRQVVCR